MFSIDEERSDYGRSQKAIVSFKKTAEVNELLKGIRLRTLTVEPMAFFEITKTVKGIIRDGLNAR